MGLRVYRSIPRDFKQRQGRFRTILGVSGGLKSVPGVFWEVSRAFQGVLETFLNIP